MNKSFWATYLRYCMPAHMQTAEQDYNVLLAEPETPEVSRPLSSCQLMVLDAFSQDRPYTFEELLESFPSTMKVAAVMSDLVVLVKNSYVVINDDNTLRRLR